MKKSPHTVGRKSDALSGISASQGAMPMCVYTRAQDAVGLERRAAMHGFI